jgi:hypothetical protein
VNENADANLATARQNGDASYNGSSAVTVYTNTARNNEAYSLVLSPQINSVVQGGSSTLPTFLLLFLTVPVSPVHSYLESLDDPSSLYNRFDPISSPIPHFSSQQSRRYQPSRCCTSNYLGRLFVYGRGPSSIL